uniref:SET domain-containing protein n=1 Tax=Bionectria ochroleuca TaxID=29856 RepID=A0A8H7K1N1_BIOOC
MDSNTASKEQNSSLEQLDEPLMFEAKTIPLKGIGLVALQDISQGTLIIQEKPLLVTRPGAPAALEAFLSSELKKLNKASQRQFLSLHNNFPGKHPFAGIMKTNALPCGSGSEIGAVYPTICRINHSCLPNSQNTWNSDTKVETIFAISPIKCGEEITISYDKGGPCAVRQASLKQSFGFQYWRPFSDVEESRESLKDCHSLLQLLKAEYGGYPGALAARLYYDAFQISIAHGGKARASIFAEKSYQARLMCEGGETPEAKKVKMLATNPSNHSSFMACSSKWKNTKKEKFVEADDEAFERWLFCISN